MAISEKQTNKLMNSQANKYTKTLFSTQQITANR